MAQDLLTRRRALMAGAVAITAPYVWSRPARAISQVVVRNPGGAWSDTQKKYIYDPFTKETGIEVVIVPSTMTKMLAMVKSGSAELDVADTGLDALVELDKAGALTPIDYSAWKYADATDVPKAYRTATTVGMALYATVLGYNKNTFPNNSQPKGWAEFWDVKKFSGARMLEDMAGGTPNLEFALIADGVPMDKIFPIDIDRAFKAMSVVKPAIKKFWDTGALSAQMLADQDVVLGSIWNGRLFAVASKGAPVAVDWNENMLQVQGYGIFKNAPNLKNAQLYVDYAMTAKAQIGMPKELNYGPTNTKVFDMLTVAEKADLPGSPENMKKAFIQDANWWSDNRAKVNAIWSKWILT